MTKQERIDELTSQLNDTRKHLTNLVDINEKLEEQVNDLLNSYDRKLEDMAYEDFKKSLNARVIKRFVKEYLKENLRIDIESDYGGYVKSEIKIGDEYVCGSSCSVISRNNPLDK